MAYESMTAFVDESGALEAEEPFVAGMWLTAYEQMWRNIVGECRDRARYGYSMHFNEISRKDADWQHRLVCDIFGQLARVSRSWYGRMMHVPETALAHWAHLSVQDKYDNLIAAMVHRFAPRAYARSITIVISDRSRPRSDHYLPHGLEAQLNRRNPRTTFRVELRNSKEDDLLQLADLLTSGIRQSYYPSENPNKKHLSNLLHPLVGGRIRAWDWPWI